MYVTATINGLPFYTHRDLDERVREAVRSDIEAGLLGTKINVERFALEHQWNEFLRYQMLNGWVN